MALIVLSIAVMLSGGAIALLAWRSTKTAGMFGCGGLVVGAAIGLAGACKVLALGQTAQLRLDWPVPYGAFILEADALSALFMLLILVLAALAAIYGAQYLKAYEAEKSLGPSWFFYNLLTVNMVLVVLARNGVLFLMAWEMMALASFFLVMFERERPGVRKAGWTYLVATHLGTIALFVLFVLMGKPSGSLDFDRFALAADGAPAAGLLFVLALIGFGTKAGIVPLYVWLPEAHPAAPSHVSALMSGVMIKTGIYGLIRFLTLLPPPPAWWGWTLIVIGMVSGILGVAFALAQHDLKRLLAYCSVENIGIIFMGIGLGVLGQSLGSIPMATLGYAGALLHTVNHAAFKGLLFLGAGSVLHATKTLDFEHLGGLLKRMPVTGVTFLIGAVAICGLPPLNGFASEFLIYVGAFEGLLSLPAEGAGIALGVIGALALIGGLSAVCFAKAFGMVFLGEPKSQHCQKAHDPGWLMQLPMIALAALCILIGLLSPLVVPLILPAILAAGELPEWVIMSIIDGSILLGWVVLCAVIFILALLVLALLRRRLLKKRSIGSTGTWDCGYAAPTARMQYSASSFAQPVTDFFNAILRTRRRQGMPQELFPVKAQLETETPDVFSERAFRPVFNAVGAVLGWFQRWHPQGIHLCILYIAVTLIALLVWKL